MSTFYFLFLMNFSNNLKNLYICFSLYILKNTNWNKYINFLNYFIQLIVISWITISKQDDRIDFSKWEVRVPNQTWNKEYEKKIDEKVNWHHWSYFFENSLFSIIILFCWRLFLFEKYSNCKMKKQLNFDLKYSSF